MSRPPRDPDPGSLIGHFGTELRTYREKAEISQNRLGEILGCTGQWIGQVELGEKAPSEQFAIDLDTYFETGGVFHRLWKSIKAGTRRLAVPTWFAEWIEIEKKAHTLKHWQPLVVPGLLQTLDYAKAVLSRQPGASPEQIEEQVRKRLERQALLTREEPLLLWAVMDEGVLRRPIAGPSVMRDQLAHLVEMSTRTNVSIQVLPEEAGGSCGLAGAFEIASIPGEQDVVYFEADSRGHVTDHPYEVTAVGNRYNALSADALSPQASIELIAKVTEEIWALT